MSASLIDKISRAELENIVKMKVGLDIEKKIEVGRCHFISITCVDGLKQR